MLEIEGLTIEFGKKRVLDNISISLEKGSVLGVVGESGSGKTMTALAIMGLLSPDVTAAYGSIRLDNREIMGLDEEKLRRIRGNDIAMIFQEPMTSLNPTMRIGKQVEEVIKLHEGADSIHSRVLDALAKVKLPESENLYRAYPHELSGGMRQRVMIAMGTVCHPDYLLCDEPTTALDVTTEKEIIKLIRQIKDEHNMGIMFITHNLKLLRGFADNVAVMCQGRIVETGTPEEIFTSPKEEYTKRLIASIPDRRRRLRNEG